MDDLVLAVFDDVLGHGVRCELCLGHCCGSGVLKCVRLFDRSSDGRAALRVELPHVFRIGHHTWTPPQIRAYSSYLDHVI